MAKCIVTFLQFRELHFPSIDPKGAERHDEGVESIDNKRNFYSTRGVPEEAQIRLV